MALIKKYDIKIGGKKNMKIVSKVKTQQEFDVMKIG
jgi:hypothetical protein